MPSPRALLTRFIGASEAEVLDLFRALPGAQDGPEESFVYVPGSRSDRLLLVGHADTVRTVDRVASGPVPFWLETRVGLIATTAYNAIYGGKREYGRPNALGADDRAGCAMLYDLFDGTHSLLITTGEESGLIGAKRVVPTLGAEEIASHSFAVEVDRRGCRQAVFYDVGTEPFKAWVVAKLNELDPESVPGDDPLWSKETGSSSDIAEICDAARLCGVNLSAGYLDEHTPDERLYVDAWLKTYVTLEKLLNEPELPRYVLPERKAFFSGRGHNDYHDYEEPWSPWWNKKTETDKPPIESIKLSNGKTIVLPPEVGKKRGKKLVKLIQAWRDNGQITQDEAVQVFQKLVDRAEVGMVAGTGSTAPAVSAMCLHWCNLCEHKAWKHIRDGKNCAVQHTHFCPTHSPDEDAVKKFQTVLYKNVRGSSEFWSSAYPGQDHLPCSTCKHTKGMHLSHISWCREKGCSCNYFMAPAARMRSLPVMANICESCHHTEVVHGETTCCIRGCTCSGFVRQV